MRILLIQPRMNMRPMDTKLKTQMSPSLALYTLLTLTPERHEVRIVNENAEDIDYDWPADLVGITVTLDVMPRAAEISARFRLLGVPVVAGGIHITSAYAYDQKLDSIITPNRQATPEAAAKRIKTRKYNSNTAASTPHVQMAPQAYPVAAGIGNNTYAMDVLSKVNVNQYINDNPDRHSNAVSPMLKQATSLDDDSLYSAASAAPQLQQTQQNPCQDIFDALLIGPAERIWARVLEDVEKGCLQASYCDMEGFSGEEIASPDYAAIPRDKYLYYNVVTTSRGCPNRCDFCYNSCAGRMYVRRPIPYVIKDIRALGTKYVLFVDDNFIGSPEYTRDLLQAISGMGLSYGAAVTANILDHPDILDAMAASGCQTLFIGFESISEESLKGVNKRNSVAKYERLIEAIHSRGIMVNASMVFGLDGDTTETFQRTLDWLVANRVETLTSHILTPYPGTALYRRMDEAGRITCRDLSKYNTANVVFRPRNMTGEQLYEGYLWMYKNFYSIRNIIRRIPCHPAQRKSFLMFNLFYRKFGKFTAALSRLLPIGTIGRIAAWISFKVK